MFIIKFIIKRKISTSNGSRQTGKPKKKKWMNIRRRIYNKYSPVGCTSSGLISCKSTETEQIGVKINLYLSSFFSIKWITPNRQT